MLGSLLLWKNLKPACSNARHVIARGTDAIGREIETPLFTAAHSNGGAWGHLPLPQICALPQN